MQFITQNWDSILLVVIVLAAVIAALRLGFKAQVNQALLALVSEIESTYGGGTGELKFSVAAKWIYENLPAIARMFLSAKTIGNLINAAVVKMKEYLSSNESAAAIIISPSNPAEESVADTTSITGGEEK